MSEHVQRAPFLLRLWFSDTVLLRFATVHGLFGGSSVQCFLLFCVLGEQFITFAYHFYHFPLTLYLFELGA